MRREGYIKRGLFAGLLAVALLPACSLIHDDDLDCQLYTEDGVPYAYVSIAINAATATPGTRTGDNPTGGEEGDGREPGQSYENEVNDLTLFFYEATEGDAGVNMEGTINIVARLHLSEDEFSYTQGNDEAATQSIAVEQLLVNHYYHVLAVVNGKDRLGDLLTKEASTLTLDDLQQATVTELYNDDYTNFLMASADNEKQFLHITPSNSETNPAKTTIDVERVTARVDYKAADSYEVSTNGGTQIGTAKITGALLVNTLKPETKSWLLKRVVDQWNNGTIEYLGLETTKEGTTTASNYVMDAKPDKAESDFVADTYFPNIGYEDLVWETLFIEGSLIENLADGYKCVGYPKENVNEYGRRDCSTGIIFRAVYTPDGMTEGETFFEWDGKTYSSLEAMMEGRFKESWEIINDGWKDVTRWEDLQADIIPKLDDDPVGYRFYLMECSNGKRGEIAAEDRNKLAWAYYLETECFYKKEDNGTVSIDINDAEDGTTRRILHEISGLSTYKNGICYYTYWIKHANDLNPDNDLLSGKGSAGNAVMEYAIVRNNVYKLNITSISMPGNDVPGDRSVNINVLVEDWQLIEPGEDIDLEPAKETEE